MEKYYLIIIFVLFIALVVGCWESYNLGFRDGVKHGKKTSKIAEGILTAVTKY